MKNVDVEKAEACIREATKEFKKIYEPLKKAAALFSEAAEHLPEVGRERSSIEGYAVICRRTADGGKDYVKRFNGMANRLKEWGTEFLIYQYKVNAKESAGLRIQSTGEAIDELLELGTDAETAEKLAARLSAIVEKLNEKAK